MRPIQITPISSTISAILAITTLLPVIVLALIVKLFVRCLVKAFFGKKADLLPGQDVVLSAKFMGTAADSVLHLFAMIDGPVTTEFLKNRAAENLLNAKNPDGTWVHPRLRASFLWFLGYRIMVVDHKEFDIDRHFEYLTAEDSGKPLVCNTEQEIEDTLEKLSRREIFPEDPELPEWKFVIFYSSVPPFGQEAHGEGAPKRLVAEVTSQSRKITTCLVLRLSHMIGDGGSLLMTVVSQMWDAETRPDPEAVFQLMRPLTQFQRCAMDLKGFLIAPLTMFRALVPGNGFRDVNPLKQRGGPQEGRYFVFPRVIPLDKLQEIRVAAGVKINVILTSCLMRASYRVCQLVTPEAESAVTLIQSQSNVPNWNWTCHVGYTLWAPGHAVECKNNFVALPYVWNKREFNLQKDPLESLRIADQTLQDPSRTTYAWSLGRMMKLLLDAGPVASWSPILALSATGATAAHTNAIGPSVMPRINGYLAKQAPLINIWQGIGIGLATVSFSNEMMVSFVGKKSAFRSGEEVRKLQEYFMEEIEDLHKAAVKCNSLRIVSC